MPNVSGAHPDIPVSGQLPVPRGEPSSTDPVNGPVVDAADHSLSESVAHGARWMAISQVSTQVLRFATNIVLAHLLVPADFGLIAIGMTEIGRAHV